MSTLRVLIVDDERLARQKLRRYLSAEPDVASVTECTGGVQAVQAIRRERPDIVFLDVQMPDVDGFDVLRQVGRSTAGAVVFVTAHDEYAVRAFEVEALDYLVKPFDGERFKAALERARRRTNSPSYQNAGPASPATVTSRDLARRRIVVRAGGRVVLLDADEIEWIESADNYVFVHTAHQTHRARETLAALEGRLDPHRFLRIHRRVIVNVDHLAQLLSLSHGGYVAQLKNGRTLHVGRKHRGALRRIFLKAG
jgi:two-component system LytT family response regulator